MSLETIYMDFINCTANLYTLVISLESSRKFVSEMEIENRFLTVKPVTSYVQVEGSALLSQRLMSYLLSSDHMNMSK